MNQTFTEKTRVQIPAIVHLTKLGYTYLSKNNLRYDNQSNILIDVFNEAISKINPEKDEYEIKQAFDELVSSLSNDDLGKKFYELLIRNTDVRFIDFDNYMNNSFNVIYEYPFSKGEEEFRPDITVLINGIPISFIEVKIPNNNEGILAERNRMNDRFKNKSFSKFFNEIQLMIFSNNMKYDDDSFEHLQGAFYCTSSKDKASFSPFREQDMHVIEQYIDVEPVNENYILRDTNSISIKNTVEYKTNCKHDTPTNSIISSLLSIERIMWLLKYGLCYCDEKDKNTSIVVTRKHIMRYPQIFASIELQKKLSDGWKKGVIWHTQGSGKTEFAYYQVKLLTDYYSKHNIVPIFYFVVDRIDLFKQACRAFKARGLEVETANSKNDFEKALTKIQNSNNISSNRIFVVNIQKFSEDTRAYVPNSYDLNIQRIFFLDEVHRSYNPNGSFLSNLLDVDKSSIKIGLTGTPLILGDYKTTDIFGGYFHKYYYNESINDGYTLRLIREPVLKAFAQKFKDSINELVKQGSVDPIKITSDTRYVSPIAEYITNDFEEFKIANSSFINSSPACMIVCENNAQAREMNRLLKDDYSTLLILHNEEDKHYREEEVYEFVNSNKYDYLIVDRMLLTGFDCDRLKKMYLLKVIKAHNLLQCLTRVNRPYKDFKYGYICDFAGILDEFRKTNDAYMRELDDIYGEEFSKTTDIFLSEDEIKKRLEIIKDVLFSFDKDNIENFCNQINEITEIDTISKLRKSLIESKELYNIARFNDHTNVFDFNMNKINLMLKEVERRFNILKFSNVMRDEYSSQQLINLALDDIVFGFIKGKSHELVLADKLRETYSRTRNEIINNIDHNDPKYVEFCDELKRILNSKGIEEASQETIDKLEQLYRKAKQKNAENQRISEKYNNDNKFCRLHKRIKDFIPLSETSLCDSLKKIKEHADLMIESNKNILDNEAYVESDLFDVVYNLIRKDNYEPNISDIDTINKWIYEEYYNEYRGVIND